MTSRVDQPPAGPSAVNATSDEYGEEDAAQSSAKQQKGRKARCRCKQKIEEQQ